MEITRSALGSIVSGKVPPSSRAGRKLARIHARDDVQQAADLYGRFSGHESEVLGKVRIPPLPKVGVLIGTVDGILYTTVRDNVTEKYIHKFRAKDRPALVVSPDGLSIMLVGGNYTFTERGIVDNSDPSA